MKIKRSYKLHLATAPAKDLRGALTHIKIDNNRAIATEGHILASVPIEIDEQEPTDTLVPVDAWKEALKVITKSTASTSIALTDETATPQGKNGSPTASYPLPKASNGSPYIYPNYIRVIPDYAKCSECKGKGQTQSEPSADTLECETCNGSGAAKTVRFSINAKYLFNLAQALDMTQVTLTVLLNKDGQPTYQAIKIESNDQNDENEAFGLVMPVRLN